MQRQEDNTDKGGRRLLIYCRGRKTALRKRQNKEAGRQY
jgi:hypothetical protein